MAVRVPIKIEFSEESLQAIRDVTERLEKIAERVAALDPSRVGKAVGREINHAAASRKRSAL